MYLGAGEVIMLPCYNFTMQEARSRKDIILFIFAVLLGVLVVGVATYKYWSLYEAHKSLENDYFLAQEEFRQKIDVLSADVAFLEGKLATTTNERNELEQNLLAEQIRVSSMKVNLDLVSGAVGTLEKLNGLDKELLQKYSRVYFLNEHFAPKSLVVIPTEYEFQPEKDKRVLGDMYPFLINMLQAAKADGINLLVLSAYRSFGEQSTLKSAYTVDYGAGTANNFSADQGYSEHQLGTTVDFTTDKLGSNFDQFKETEAYTWLVENGSMYGFVLSYPENNQYYVFEPWHWRFVGKRLAHRLMTANQYFYDMEQRDIDQYLISIFDR